MRFRNSTVIVTGASQGIGSSLARLLGSEGANVVCAARSKAGLEETVASVRESGGTALAIPTDVSDDGAIARLMEQSVAAFGKIDILVNNAALVGHKTSLDTPLAAFDTEMNVNFRGTLAAIYAALPYLKATRGRILNISSLIALNSMPGMLAYGVSKIAVERLTMEAAERLVEFGIACNCLRIDLPVFPGGKPRRKEGLDENARKEIETMARYAEPLETGAAAMAWMLSQDTAVYSGKLESLRDIVSRGDVKATAPELLPTAFYPRWSW